jgi:hypothetical protein
MGTLLLQHPLVQLYLLYIGVLAVIHCVCAMTRQDKPPWLVSKSAPQTDQEVKPLDPVLRRDPAHPEGRNHLVRGSVLETKRSQKERLT